jgi:hypothetical protein
MTDLQFELLRAIADQTDRVALLAATDERGVLVRDRAWFLRNRPRWAFRELAGGIKWDPVAWGLRGHYKALQRAAIRLEATGLIERIRAGHCEALTTHVRLTSAGRDALTQASAPCAGT